MENTLEMEVMQSFGIVVRQACRTAKEKYKSNFQLVDAADTILDETMKLKRSQGGEQATWSRFCTQLEAIIGSELPAHHPLAKLPKDDVKEAQACLAQHGYTAPAPAKAQAQVSKKANQSGPSLQQNTHKFLELLANWVCSKCGNKGHKPKDCTNPPNPKGAELAEKARVEVTKRRTERLSRETTRRRLRDANDKIAAQDAAEPGSPTKKGKTHEQIVAGLAGVNWDSTAFEDEDGEDAF